jgi:hypothetical protein
MTRLFASIIVVAAIAAPALASGQGLADLAKKEEARRKTVKPARKVYSNDDLKTDGTSAAPATAAGTNAPAPSSQVPSTTQPAGKPEDAAPSEAKDQAYWSNRVRTARAGLDRSRIFADALQSRINALNNDFVNRDDPAQRAQIELERQRAVGELERVKREIADQAKVIADIEEEARKAGVPPGWLR